MMNFHFISYFNYSNNLDLKKKFKKKISKNFNNFFIYTPLYIKKNYPNLIWTTKNYRKYYLKKLDKYDVKFKPYWFMNGFQSWKPQIILCHLNKINKNEYLIYHDINFKKYKYYLENFNVNQNYFKKIVKNKSIVLFRDSYQSIENQCKSGLIKKYLNKNFNINSNGFWSGIIIIKNDKKGKKFLLLASLDLTG